MLNSLVIQSKDCITDCMSHTLEIIKLGNTILIVLPIVLSDLLIVLLVHFKLYFRITIVLAIVFVVQNKPKLYF